MQSEMMLAQTTVIRTHQNTELETTHRVDRVVVSCWVVVVVVVVLSLEGRQLLSRQEWLHWMGIGL